MTVCQTLQQCCSFVPRLPQFFSTARRKRRESGKIYCEHDIGQKRLQAHRALTVTRGKVKMDIIDEMHPYTFFIEIRLLGNWLQGCISSMIIPIPLVCVLLVLPSLLISSTLLVAFYNCNFWSSGQHLRVQFYMDMWSDIYLER